MFEIGQEYRTIDTTSWGDQAAANAARGFLQDLQAQLTGTNGHHGTCVVAYYVPDQEFATIETIEADYAGIKLWFLDRVGAELQEYGLATWTELLQPWCPIKIAFGRVMSAGRNLPDRFVTDGNSPALMSQVAVVFGASSADADADLTSLEIELASL